MIGALKPNIWIPSNKKGVASRNTIGGFVFLRWPWFVYVLVVFLIERTMLIYFPKAFAWLTFLILRLKHWSIITSIIRLPDHRRDCSNPVAVQLSGFPALSSSPAVRIELEDEHGQDTVPLQLFSKTLNSSPFFWLNSPPNSPQLVLLKKTLCQFFYF